MSFKIPTVLLQLICYFHFLMRKEWSFFLCMYICMISIIILDSESMISFYYCDKGLCSGLRGKARICDINKTRIKWIVTWCVCCFFLCSAISRVENSAGGIGLVSVHVPCRHHWAQLRLNILVAIDHRLLKSKIWNLWKKHSFVNNFSTWAS